jgi:hypothetical protein
MRLHRDYDPDRPTANESDYFGNCSVCGSFIDIRDLGQVLTHIHDAEIEIGLGRSGLRFAFRSSRSPRQMPIACAISIHATAITTNNAARPMSGVAGSGRVMMRWDGKGSEKPARR